MLFRTFGGSVRGFTNENLCVIIISVQEKNNGPQVELRGTAKESYRAEAILLYSSFFFQSKHQNYSQLKNLKFKEKSDVTEIEK